MSVRFDNSADQLNRTTNAPSSSLYTIMGWFYPVTLASGQYRACLSFEETTGDTVYNVLYARRSGASVLTITNGSVDFTGSTTSTATWYHFALVCDGTGTGNLRAYRNGILDITGDGNTNFNAGSKFVVGTTKDDEPFDGRAAAIKIYGAALTADEILNEMRQVLPMRWANLNGFYPLIAHTDLVDYSGNGNSFSSAGTLTTEDGPPIPWRCGRSKLFLPAAAPAVGHPAGRRTGLVRFGRQVEVGREGVKVA